MRVTCHTITASFDLVGADHDGCRDGEAERFCGFEVDLEFSCLLDWQIAGLCALEDFAHKDGRPAIRFETVHPVAEQTAGFREFLTADSWKLMLSASIAIASKWPNYQDRPLDVRPFFFNRSSLLHIKAVVIDWAASSRWPRILHNQHKSPGLGM